MLIHPVVVILLLLNSVTTFAQMDGTRHFKPLGPDAKENLLQKNKHLRKEAYMHGEEAERNTKSAEHHREKKRDSFKMMCSTINENCRTAPANGAGLGTIVDHAVTGTIERVKQHRSEKAADRAREKVHEALEKISENDRLLVGAPPSYETYEKKEKEKLRKVPRVTSDGSERAPPYSIQSPPPSQREARPALVPIKE